MAVANVTSSASGASKGKSKAMRPSDKQALDVLQESVAALSVAVQAGSSSSAAPGPVIASTDTDLEQARPVTNNLRNDDEKTQLSLLSNPTLSADVRSIVSGPGFNMDEKESIRPDESASVKGADESDSASGPISGGLQSRVASETGKDGFQDQFQEVSTAKKALPLTANLVGRVPEDMNRTVIPPVIEFQAQVPDDKLLDALENPKDRIFLLQLEQQVIAFVSNESESELSLPPQNSFCRLLAHRLGDYYALSHTADTALGSVRLGKTETTRLPPSLKDIANSRVSEASNPQQQPALKIMRRGKPGAYTQSARTGDGTVTSSAIQSQAGSDAGASGTDSQQSPSKGTKNMTREEREAHYQATRDRIFSDLEEAKPSTETSTAASRASSTTGGKTKKNKSRPKNDDFEPRSMFMSMGYQQQQQQQVPAMFTYGDRQQPLTYGFSPQTGPAMLPQPSPGGYADAGMNNVPGFYSHPVQVQNGTGQPQQIPSGGNMHPFPQANYAGQPMYNGGYAYSGHGQPVGPMSPQQHYYAGPDPANSYNNMMPAPMSNHNQQSYATPFQGWSNAIPAQYSGQDPSAYPAQPPQNGNTNGGIYSMGQKSNGIAASQTAQFNPGEYNMGAAPYTLQPQHQQAQWQQWQGPPQYGQFPSPPNTWQAAQSNVQGSQMPQMMMMQSQNMNTYLPQNANQGKSGKRASHKNGGKPSELGKYDTSSLPPKPPAPLQGEQ